VSDRYSEVAQQLRADVTAAVRRVQRRHIMRLAASYTAVVLLTAGLVAAGVLARRYIHSLTAPWRLLLILLLWLTIASGIVFLASLRRSAPSHPGLEQGHGRQNIWRAMVRMALEPAPTWVAVLAVAAVLVAAGALAYENWSGAVEWRMSSDPLVTLGASAGALLAIFLLRAAALRRWWGGRDAAPGNDLASPAENIQTRAHAGQAEVATERVDDGTQTFIVRLIPHHDPGIQILQEVAG
jgi:hypothetical protein